MLLLFLFFFMASVDLRVLNGHWTLASSSVHRVSLPLNALSRDGTVPCQVCVSS